jgi:23S rRNA (uracil1939-C5)-methyltransferase
MSQDTSDGQSPSESAAAPADCPHRPPCPGCPRFGAGGLDPEVQTALNALAQTSSLPEPQVHVGPGLGWRHRARLMVRGRARSPKVGLFQAGSHRIADTPNCAVHHPLINAVAAELKAAIRETGTRPYADGPDVGCVRALQVVVARASQTAQVVVITNEATPEPSAALLLNLQARLRDRLHGLFWNGNPGRHNTLVGPHWKHIGGEAAIVENICGADVHFPPDAFGQANLNLADLLVARIADCVPASAQVADLYSGCGSIGLPLLQRGHVVHFNERAAGSLQGLQRALDRLSPSDQTRARVHPGDAADYSETSSFLSECDTIIVDPPRKGIDPALLERVMAHAPDRFIYVSCGFPAFLAHARALTDRGFRMTHLEAFALFPFSEHVETLAVFEPPLEPPL